MESTPTDPGNDGSSLFGSWSVRRAAIVAVALLVSAPFIVRGSDLGLKSMFNAPLMWVDHQAEARQQFNEFLEQFGAHEMIVVSWPGCTVDDDRLVKATESLEDVQKQRAAAGDPPYFTHVLSGKTMLEVLTSVPIELSRKGALRRLGGVLVGANGRSSCVVVELTVQGGVNRRKSIPLIIEAVSQATGLKGEELIISGPAVDGLAIDNESIRSIETYNIPSVLISLVLCWICLRSIWLTIPILIIGAWAQGLMLASIYYGGETMNAIVIVLPALVFVLTVSAGVHLAHYFLEEVVCGNASQAPQRALQKAKGPCVLAAVTTAIGLASLCVSEVEPVRQFGFLGAIGVVVCVWLLFLMVPGFMELWLRISSKRRSDKLSNAMNHSKTSSFARDQTVAIRRPLLRTAQVMIRFGWLIRLACLIAMIACGVGLTKLRTSINVFSLLSEDNQAVKDFHWIENNICPLVPIEVVVHFDRESNVTLLDRLKIIAVVQHTMSEIDLLDGTMSAVSFIPSFPNLGGIGGSVRKTVFLNQVERSRDDLIEANYLAETEQGEAWRISARIPGQANFDYGEFIQRLQSEVDQVLGKAEAAGYSGISSSSTGVLVLVYQVQKMLLADLFKSFLIALLLVAVVMMIALRSVVGGLLAMLPNIFPPVILFGAMGWSEHAIDIGTVMTASVALGIAVDGTFHFLKWFTQSLKQGMSQETAIAIAYQRCSGALIQTTIICACGLLIYSFSDFLPVRHFAWVLLMMLVAALFGDLILLPALLAGKLGRRLCRANQPPAIVLNSSSRPAAAE